MTRERDIERVLDAWFEPGPTEMPDRLFDDVLARVDRLPQRRALPSLRFPAMNSPIRWLALAAAALVVALGGLALINRPDGNVGASPTPSATPTTLPSSPLPAELVGQWMGSVKPIPGIALGVGSSLFLGGGRLNVSPSNENPIRSFNSTASATGANRIRVESTDARQCSLGASGEYTWSLSAAGRVLTIDSPTDDCSSRSDVILGTWWKMDCPTADDPCLGDVEPGAYASQFIDPFVASGGPWKPRFAAMTYTVPDGWSNIEDWPQSFKLAPRDAPHDTDILLWTDPVAHVQADPCSDGAEPGIGRTSDAIASWLTTLPGLVATTPETLAIGGLSGFRLDLSIASGWTATCPYAYSEGLPLVSLFTDSQPGEGFDWNIQGEGRMRIILLDVGDGRSLLILIEAPSQGDFDAFEADATTVVESFEFTR